jgi:hypothetical protein
MFLILACLGGDCIAYDKSLCVRVVAHVELVSQ